MVSEHLQKGDEAWPTKRPHVDGSGPDTALRPSNPTLSKGENVINAVAEAFFTAISPDGAEGKQSRAVTFRIVQLLDNPVFHFTCRAWKDQLVVASAMTASRDVATYRASTDYLRCFVESAERSRRIQSHNTCDPALRDFIRYILPPKGISAEALAARIEERDHSATYNPLDLLGRLRAPSEKLPGIARCAVDAVQSFYVRDFHLVLGRLMTTGTTPEASRSDRALQSIADLYRGFAEFMGDYASLVMSDKQSDNLARAHGCRNLEEAVGDACSAMNARLTAARVDFAAKQAAQEARASLVEASKLEQYRREALAAQSAEHKRQQREEAEKAEALRVFHSQFQEVPLPEAVENMLKRLEYGEGVPASHRRDAERIVTRIVAPLRKDLFDWRGEAPDRKGDTHVEQFAALVFSPTNIGSLAKAFGIEAQKCLNVSLPTGRSAVESTVLHVCDLYSTSRAVRGLVQTMLAQADGILALATLLMPPQEAARYAQQRNWDATGVDRTGRDIRTPLALTIRRVIEDRHIIRVAREALSSSTPSVPTERKKVQVELPEWIDEVVNPEEFAVFQDEGSVLVAARETPHIAMYIPSKSFVSKEFFQKEYKHKLNELLSEVEVEKRVERFEKMYGFSLARETTTHGRIITLHHEMYNLTVTLSGHPNKWHAPLDSLEQQFQQIATSWSLLLERAEKVGFEVYRSLEGTELRHPTLGRHQLSSSSVLPVGQLHRVTALIDEALTTQHRLERERQSHERRTRKLDRILREEVLPGLGDEVVVVDANVFMSLVAPRGGGATWLDLLSATAALPKVRMMIPAIVADFELMGRIVPFASASEDPAGKTVLSWTSTAVNSFKEFFDGATRIKIGRDQNGDPTVDEALLGTNRNLCIVESPGDEEFYKRVYDLQRESGGNAARFLELVRASLYHQGEGDAAITRFLAHSPFYNRVTVISSDVRYVKHEMPVSTALGAPVSSCSTGSYVEAECGARGGQLADILGAGESVHFHTIADDVTRHSLQASGEPLYLFPFVRMGGQPSGELRARSFASVIDAV